MNINTKAGMASAVKWMQGFLNQINDGVTWAIPRTNAVYRIEHSAKRFIRLTLERDTSTERVVKEMGWRVEPQKVEV